MTLTPQQAIMAMVKRQDDEFARLGLSWDGLFGRRLHAIDCQGLFCEIDKYSRMAFPQLKSNRVRIKQEFRPLPDPIPLTYPPKWGLDLPDDVTDGSARSSDRARSLGDEGDQLAISSAQISAA